jgi:hypothetical protein
MKKLLLLVALLSAPAGCSGGCSGGGATPADSGDTGSADADSDADADGDSDTGLPDTDACDPDNAVFTNGSWEWEDLPEGIDCGTGCAQLTFSDEVRDFQWDVWGDLLAYVDETSYVHVVDIPNRRKLTIPNIYPQLEVGKMGNAAMIWPAVYERKVYYSYVTTTGLSENDPYPMGLLLVVDLDAQTQTVLSARRRTDGGGGCTPPNKSDVYGDRLVAWFGCGAFGESNLCLFDTKTVCGTGQIIHQGGALDVLSVWEDRFSFQNGQWDWDIMIHDFVGGQTNEVMSQYTQGYPRMHSSRVVYVDFRYSASGFEGSWDHAAVFLYDLDAQQETQLTNAEWICSNPDVFGDLAIWTDYRFSAQPNDKEAAEGVEIFGLNLATQQAAQISHFPNRKAFPRLWGDRAYIQMFYAPGKDAVFSFDVPEELR